MATTHEIDRKPSMAGDGDPSTEIDYDGDATTTSACRTARSFSTSTTSTTAASSSNNNNITSDNITNGNITNDKQALSRKSCTTTLSNCNSNCNSAASNANTNSTQQTHPSVPSSSQATDHEHEHEHDDNGIDNGIDNDLQRVVSDKQQKQKQQQQMSNAPPNTSSNDATTTTTAIAITTHHSNSISNSNSDNTDNTDNTDNNPLITPTTPTTPQRRQQSGMGMSSSLALRASMRSMNSRSSRRRRRTLGNASARNSSVVGFSDDSDIKRAAAMLSSDPLYKEDSVYASSEFSSPHHRMSLATATTAIDREARYRQMVELVEAEGRTHPQQQQQQQQQHGEKGNANNTTTTNNQRTSRVSIISRASQASRGSMINMDDYDPEAGKQQDSEKEKQQAQQQQQQQHQNTTENNNNNNNNNNRDAKFHPQVGAFHETISSEVAEFRLRSHPTQRISIADNTTNSVPPPPTTTIPEEEQPQQTYLAAAEPAPSRAELADMIRQDLQPEIRNRIERQFRETEAQPKAVIAVDVSTQNNTDEANQTITSGDASANHNNQDKPQQPQSYKIFLFIFVIVVAVIGITVGILLSRNNDSNDSNTSSLRTIAPLVIPQTQVPTPAPTQFDQTEEFFTLLELVKPSLIGSPTFVDESSFFIPSSVPYRVLDWMANVDEETKNLLSDDQLVLQRYCVFSLFLQWDYENWNTLPDSMTTTSVCDWNTRSSHGILCDETGLVRTITLGSNNLNGSLLPLELYHLQRLQVFSVPENSLTGTLSPMIAQFLPNLTVLDTSDLPITGPLPAELGSLLDLETLAVFRANLSGTIPTEFGQLTKLQTLQVNDNSLSGMIPSELGKLVALQLLFLSSNAFHGSLPAEFINLNNLTEFWLIGTSITGNLDPMFCSIDNPFDQLAVFASDCLGSTPDGTQLSKTVCSCCSGCADGFVGNVVFWKNQDPQPPRCDNAGCVACDLGVYEESCGECPMLENDTQLCLGACRWNFETSICEARVEFGL